MTVAGDQCFTISGTLVAGRRVAAALGADDAVDDGHADAGQVAERNTVQNVLAGGMLRLIHDDSGCTPVPAGHRCQ